MFREIGAALLVLLLILSGVLLIWRANRAERKRQERLAEGVDVEERRQRNMKMGNQR